ncbi:MAG: hypothetical protein ABIK65_00710 [Candidatus Eisenbacteria bacterium]
MDQVDHRVPQEDTGHFDPAGEEGEDLDRYRSFREFEEGGFPLDRIADDQARDGSAEGIDGDLRLFHRDRSADRLGHLLDDEGPHLLGRIEEPRRHDGGDNDNDDRDGDDGDPLAHDSISPEFLFWTDSP